MTEFRKLLECDYCINHSDNSYLRCAIHPSGIEGETCLDFQEDPQAEQRKAEFLRLDWVAGEQWQPEGASYYNDELVIDVIQRFTREQKLELLDSHPMFTGRCPECESAIGWSSPAQIHWDCPCCGWEDDSV